MTIKQIQFGKATDKQLKTAAKWAGLDELNPGIANVIEDAKISSGDRDLLIDGLSSFGYSYIKVDGSYISAGK